MSDLALADDENRNWTYADYKDWELKPGERFELIDGVAYAMAAPSTRHQLVVTTLTIEIGDFLKGKPCQVIVSPFDVRLFYDEDESDNTVIQPDLVVVCDPAKLGKEGCRGAPDLMIEIISPSNSVLEMYRKRDRYFEAGGREFWLVDPDQKVVAVYHLKMGKFVSESFGIADTVKSEVLPGLEIKAETLFQ